MARECAAGKGRAPVLPGGPARGRCVQESPTCSPPVETPQVPEGAHFSFCSLGSQLEPLNFQGSSPSCSLGSTLTNGPLDLLPRH